MSVGHCIIQPSKSHLMSGFVPSPNNFTRVLNPMPQESALELINCFLSHLIFHTTSLSIFKIKSQYSPSASKYMVTNYCKSS